MPGNYRVVNAATIVTANVTDFPHDAVERFDVEAVHPDEFLLDQLDLAPRLILAVLTQQPPATRATP
jgi:hypothetical protein